MASGTGGSGGGGGTPQPYATVVFPQYDFAARMKARALKQFTNSPVFQALLTKFAIELRAFSDACMQSMAYRTIEGAIEYQLDVLGRILGQGRVIPYYYVTDRVWVTTDTDGAEMDNVSAWATNGLDGSGYSMTDDEYRAMLIAKIQRNHFKFGSAQEIMDFGQLALGIPVSATVTQPTSVWFSTDTAHSGMDTVPAGLTATGTFGDLTIYVPNGTPEWKIRFIQRFITDQRGQSIPAMPYPATRLVHQVVTI